MNNIRNLYIRIGNVVRKNSYGFSTMVVILIFASISTVAVISFANLVLTNFRISRGSTFGLTAYQVAEAGVERVIAEWISNPRPTAGTLYSQIPMYDSSGEALGEYTVTVTDLGGGGWQIRSRGTSRWAVREILVRTGVSLGGPDFAFSHALYSGQSVALPNGTNIWGSVYVHGTSTWASGNLYATNATGTHFSINPTASNAPFGRFTYYYGNPLDVWQVVPSGATANGDAHGFWQSAQSISRTAVWMNPQLNIGNPAIAGSGQYWDRDGVGAESLMPGAATAYAEKTGIPVRNRNAPILLPVVGNGTRENFISFYDANAPKGAQFSQVAVLESSSGPSILLSNGNNSAIIGTSGNANGFLRQFTWTGTAVRGDTTVYSGPFYFPDDFALYVDGNVSITSGIGSKSLTIIASGDVTITTNTLPSDNLTVIAAGRVIINTTSAIKGTLYSATEISFTNGATGPRVTGSVVGKRITTTSAAGTEFTFNQDLVLRVGRWLPGISIPTVDLISWNEVPPL